jgi:serine O-acetyltransferase
MRFGDRMTRTRAAQPPLGRALRADAVAFAAHRGEAFRFRNRMEEWRNVARLFMRSADYTAMAMYRIRTSLHRAGVPVAPTLLRKACVALFGLRIGDDVVIREGVYIPHGTVVIDGTTSIDRGCVITPWATIANVTGETGGPVLGAGVFVGSHAAVIGDVTVGQAAQIGAGAIVTTDVDARTIVAGVPARVLAEGIPGPIEAALPPIEVVE